MRKKLKHYLSIITIMLALLCLTNCGGQNFVYNQNKKIKYANLSYGFTVKYVDLGIKFGKVAYIDEGQGEQTILFLHGISTYSKYFMHQIEYLKKYYRVIALDMPGYGKSAYKPNVNYQFSYHYQGVVTFINELNLKNIVIAGLSYGGGMAVAISSTPRLDIKKVVLMAPWGLQYFNNEDRNFFRKNLTRFVKVKVTSDEMIDSWHSRYIYKRSQIVDTFLKEWLGLIHSGDYLRSSKIRFSVLKNGVNSAQGNVLNRRFRTIKVPILLLAGINDEVVPVYQPSKRTRPNTEAYFRSISRLNKKCILKFIDNCGHMVPIEKPMIVNVAIHNFIKNN